jgi:H3 lysine-79-specific histone-lysine N-methyltransferase
MWGGAKSAIKPVSQQTRTERIAAAKPPAPLPSRLASQSKSARKAQDSKRSLPASAPSKRSSATPDRLDVPSAKRKASRQRSPGELKPNFGEDSDDDDDARSRSSVGSNKRQETEPLSPTIDTKRKLRSKRAFSLDDHGEFPMIHAADVASPVRKSKIPDIQAHKVTVELKYPSASQRERYAAVKVCCGEADID